MDTEQLENEKKTIHSKRTEISTETNIKELNFGKGLWFHNL